MALGNESDGDGVVLPPAGDPRRNVLDLDDFSAEEIISVLDDTGGMVEVLRRDIKKVPTLRGRVVVTMFYGIQHAHPNLLRGSGQGAQRRRHQYVRLRQ